MFIFVVRYTALSTRFDLIWRYHGILALGILARFCLKTQVTPVVAAPLAAVAVFAWMLLQSPIILRDIDQPFHAFHPYERHKDPFRQQPAFHEDNNQYRKPQDQSIKQRMNHV
jgi:hypothetical protein